MAALAYPYDIPYLRKQPLRSLSPWDVYRIELYEFMHCLRVAMNEARASVYKYDSTWFSYWTGRWVSIKYHMSTYWIYSGRDDEKELLIEQFENEIYFLINQYQDIKRPRIHQ